MAMRDIKTTQEQMSCDVCGRTLLRGERAETYLDGSVRREVCELCSPRALHEGWIREGALPEGGLSPGGTDRRRSLLGRLRQRREREPGDYAEPAAPVTAGQPLPEPEAGARPASSPEPRARPESRSRFDGSPREARQVRAVPTSFEQKIVAALERFNGSEHPRTVAGVARSLGAPAVAARPLTGRPSTVRIVVAWELCWYRYEVDLSEDATTVAPAGQGYELDELEAEEREVNAVSDERGALALA